MNSVKSLKVMQAARLLRELPPSVRLAAITDVERANPGNVQLLRLLAELRAELGIPDDDAPATGGQGDLL